MIYESLMMQIVLPLEFFLGVLLVSVRDHRRPLAAPNAALLPELLAELIDRVLCSALLWGFIMYRLCVLLSDLGRLSLLQDRTSGGGALLGLEQGRFSLDLS